MAHPASNQNGPLDDRMRGSEQFDDRRNGAYDRRDLDRDGGYGHYDGRRDFDRRDGGLSHHDELKGSKHATVSLVLGILGFFFFGIILGPLAIWQAGKAKKYGVKATAGKVLGWIVTILSILAILLGIAAAIFLAASGMTLNDVVNNQELDADSVNLGLALLG
ncbi:DUF4870 domain-containing protein [Micrococcus cohnii]|uniref:Putative Tic20 family protein n=1 Tax=Micrococcus cohnii TaxID=993416 RepID=A0A7W7GLR4_9MICC|nr:DUF4870 domain-containing protein [Micrococcus cohnii]MBB4734557.1 putative Tic20 family protein [Micrococcus cohnii]